MTFTPVAREKDLRSRFDRARMAVSRLEGVRDGIVQRKSDLEQAVGNAKGRLQLGENVGGLIEALQRRAHERSVGSFERLLSAIVRDVIPEKGNVKFDLGLERGLAALDVLITNNGFDEDVLSSNGGAVTNVITTGLRYAALSRTNNRRLMVLDEPDCWIKPDRIPMFASVVHKVSEALDIQTLMISHHAIDDFEGKATIVRFTLNADGTIDARPVGPVANEWTSDEQHGIRKIELFNVGAHKHTTIPCYPRLNAFIGDNDLGKSTAIARSLRAVAYGESTDRLIHHGAEEAKIVLYLEQGQRIEWSRQPKRNPVVLYRLFKDDVLQKEGRPGQRNSAPEWVTEVLGISPVDDLDIQVCDQKQPVFLLQESASKRAKILSVGRESGHLAAFMGAYDSIKRADRETVRSGEIELRLLNYKAGYCSAVQPLVDSLGSLQPDVEQIEVMGYRSEHMRSLISRAASAEADVAHGTSILKVLEEVPAQLPDLADTSELARLMTRLEQAQRRASVKPVAWPSVDLPQLHDTAYLSQLIDQLIKYERVASLKAGIPSLQDVPDLFDTARLVQVAQRIRAAGVVAQLADRLPAVPSHDELPVLTDTDHLEDLVRRIEVAQKVTKLGKVLPALPDLPELDEDRLKLITRLGKAIMEGAAAVKVLNAEMIQTTAELQAVAEEIERIKDEMGGCCPLCGADFPEQGVEHEHA